MNLMGYLISSLATLPYSKTNEFYIFLLSGAPYQGGVLENVLNNFDILAKEIGPKAVIARGMDQKEFRFQVAEKYLKGVKNIYDYFPAILITDTHPDDINEGAFKILVSLDRINKNSIGIEKFLEMLVDFVRHKSDEFASYAKSNLNWIREANEVVQLKPNFMGIGINLNALIDILMEAKKI